MMWLGGEVGLILDVFNSSTHLMLVIQSCHIEDNFSHGKQFSDELVSRYISFTY